MMGGAFFDVLELCNHRLVMNKYSYFLRLLLTVASRVRYNNLARNFWRNWQE